MAGRLAERTARRGDPVAPVLWLNLLAHGSEADLLACAGLARPVRRRGRGSGDLVGWVVARAWRRPTAIGTGLVVWPVTVAAAMVLRAMAGQGTAPAFIGVALAFVGLGLMGWRSLASAATRRRS